ncbi:hypothetical protein BGW38_006594, partial [Lunasporangiospora selenospora]
RDSNSPIRSQHHRLFNAPETQSSTARAVSYQYSTSLCTTFSGGCMTTDPINVTTSERPLPTTPLTPPCSNSSIRKRRLSCTKDSPGRFADSDSQFSRASPNGTILITPPTTSLCPERESITLIKVSEVDLMKDDLDIFGGSRNVANRHSTEHTGDLQQRSEEIRSGLDNRRKSPVEARNEQDGSRHLPGILQPDTLTTKAIQVGAKKPLQRSRSFPVSLLNRNHFTPSPGITSDSDSDGYSSDEPSSTEPRESNTHIYGAVSSRKISQGKSTAVSRPSYNSQFRHRESLIAQHPNPSDLEEPTIQSRKNRRSSYLGRLLKSFQKFERLARELNCCGSRSKRWRESFQTRNPKGSTEEDLDRLLRVNSPEIEGIDVAPETNWNDITDESIMWEEEPSDISEEDIQAATHQMKQWERLRSRRKKKGGVVRKRIDLIDTESLATDRMSSSESLSSTPPKHQIYEEEQEIERQWSHKLTIQQGCHQIRDTPESWDEGSNSTPSEPLYSNPFPDIYKAGRCNGIVAGIRSGADLKGQAQVHQFGPRSQQGQHIQQPEGLSAYRRQRHDASENPSNYTTHPKSNTTFPWVWPKQRVTFSSILRHNSNCLQSVLDSPSTCSQSEDLCENNNIVSTICPNSGSGNHAGNKGQSDRYYSFRQTRQGLVVVEGHECDKSDAD